MRGNSLSFLKPNPVLLLLSFSASSHTVRGIEGYKQNPFQGVLSLPFTFKMSGDRGGVVYLVAEAALRLPLG